MRIGKVTPHLGPYDFHDADEITESSDKNRIYCTTQKVTELAKFWMDKSRIGRYT